MLNLNIDLDFNWSSILKLNSYPSTLFNSVWYIERYPDVRKSKLSAIQHYRKYGALEGRDPSPLFDSVWYSNQHGGLIEKKINPLDHFIRNRKDQQCDPHPLFNTNWYLSQLSAQGKRNDSRLDALSHFVVKGWKCGVNPHPLFDVQYYCSQVNDHREFRPDPLSHYLTVGWRQGLRPHPIFDPRWYVERYKDVRDADIEPLTHYLRIGWLENRLPIPMFSVETCRMVYGLPAHINPFIHHVISRWNKDSIEKHINGRPHYARLRLIEAAQLNTAKPIGVFLHFIGDRSLHEVTSYLSRIDIPMSIHVTTSCAEDKTRLRRFFEKLGHVDITVVPKDVGALAPLLVTHRAKMVDYDICLMIAEEARDVNVTQYENTRRILLDDLLGTASRVKAIVGAFLNDAALGIAVAAPDNTCAALNELSGPLMREIHHLTSLMGLTGVANKSLTASATLVFWFRPASLSSLLLQELEWSDFVGEAGRVRSKAIEFIIPMLCEAENRKCGIVPGLWDKYQLTQDGLRRLLNQQHAFDVEYYLTVYPDIAKAEIDPLEHWITTGVREGRNPSAWFNTGYYMRVIRANWASPINPLAHYFLEGKAQGLPTVSPEKVKASIEIEDLYSHYTKAESQPQYVPETRPFVRCTDIKLVAFYLPQFHSFAENDKFWGRGFTEWTNTSKALPLFKGHYQPRLPGELGFYDVRLKSVLTRQIELAKQYGIHGWCLHHYFFEGKKVMRTVYDTLLENPDLDIPFCLHWANEPWTVRFDGLSSKSGILIDQRHNPEDDLAFFDDIAPALRDRRYIHINGRPLLLVYRPALFPDIKATVERWHARCEKLGIEKLYLAVVQTSFEGEVDPREYGFDAAVEFPPHNYHLSDVGHRVDLYDPGSPLGLYDYAHLVDRALTRSETPYRLFRGIVPEWDNSARRANCGVYINCAPHRYRRWLEGLCEKTDDKRPADEKLIFINAWNEWAEGAYLEPDRKYGYAYLNATAQALNTYRPLNIDQLDLNILVILHIFYLDLLDEFITYLRNIPTRFDIFVSTPKENVSTVTAYMRERMSNCANNLEVIGVDNVGFDFGPFILEGLRRALKYDLCCKIHSKKTPYNSTFNGWREYLLDNLLGSPENISVILEYFKSNPKLGLLYPPPYGPIINDIGWGSNYKIASSLLKSLDIDSDEEELVGFPSGSMFWFRPEALAPLLKLKLNVEDFCGNQKAARDSSGIAIIDGTIAHALERMVGYVAKSVGYNAHEGVFMS